MTGKAWHVLIAAAMLSGCSRTTPEQRIVEDAATALGGRDKVQSVSTLTLEGQGTAGNLGQDMTPDATSQTFRVTSYKRSLDIRSGRARVEQTRTPNFAYFQGQAAQKQVIGIDGDVSYNVAANGTATRVPDAAARDRQAEIYHHPLTMIRVALDSATKLTNARKQDNLNLVDVTTPQGLELTLETDGTTKLPVLVRSRTDNTNLGDVVIETSFFDYQDVGGLKLPARITTKTDKYTTADLQVTKQVVDDDVGDLAAPAAAASAPPTTVPPPARVTVEEIAEGVWFLAGQSHNSVLIEFGDHMTLIEVPQNDTRTLAVLDKVKELRPDKPLTSVVNTHHHFDHSGGIRAAVSQGVTIVTQKANEAFYREAAERPHTLVPDALSRFPKPLKIETVDQEMELRDENRIVNLYRVAGSAHAETMLMAYLPKERLLVEADVFTPGAGAAPFAANLLENIQTRHLRVDRIVPLHGAIAPFSELVKVVQTPASTTEATRP